MNNQSMILQNVNFLVNFLPNSKTSYEYQNVLSTVLSTRCMVILVASIYPRASKTMFSTKSIHKEETFYCMVPMSAQALFVERVTMTYIIGVGLV